MRTSLAAIAALAFGALIAAAPAALADDATFEAELGGAQLRPPTASAAMGFVRLALDTETREVIWIVTYQGLSGPATDVRLRSDDGVDEALTRLGGFRSPIHGGRALDPTTMQRLLDGGLELVIMSGAFPMGELAGTFKLVELKKSHGGDD